MASLAQQQLPKEMSGEKKEQALAPKEDLLPLYEFTFVSSDSKRLHNCLDGFYRKFKELRSQNLQVSNLKCYPTRIKKLTTRRTPCGEGSKTWDRFTLRVYKIRFTVIGETNLVTSKMPTLTTDKGVFVDIVVKQRSN